MTKSYFLGIDGGGTKTAAVLIDDFGQEIARVVSGPSNFYSVGQALAEASLREAIRKVLTVANLPATHVTAIGLGMAGVDRPGDRQVLRAMLSRIARFSHVVIANDAETALVGGVGRRYGAVLIAGTGAIAYGVNAAGETRRADGWGYLIGDEGSAHWIGLEGLRTVMRAHDGRGPVTALKECLISRLDLSDVSALIVRVYAADFGVPQLAALAPLVSQAARDGDGMAQDILRESGQRLSAALGAVIRGLDMTAEVFEVVLLGGVLRARDLVRETVVNALTGIAPHAQVIEPRNDAAVGAALLARQMGE
jgi:N-acetylglucosamine kinase